MSTTRKTGREEWAKRVEAWQQSGLKAAEFGRLHGFDGRQLTWWKWQLGRQGSISTSGKVERKGAPMRFATGRIRGLSEVSESGIEILLDNGRTVRVRGRVDLGLLGEVLTIAASS